MAVSFSRPALPPLPLLSLVTLGLLMAVSLAAWWSVQGPWLGLDLKRESAQGLRIVAVDSQGPLAEWVEPGRKLIGLRSDGAVLSLAGYEPAQNPHAAVTYGEYEAYMQRQGGVARLLNQGEVSLVFNDGEELTVVPASLRPLSSLPLTFWLLNLFGMLACLIGVSVWVFRPGEWPARLLALSGAGFFIATLQHSIWNARELALPLIEFELLMRGNHVGLHLMLVSLLLMMAIYPRRLRYSQLMITCLLLLTVIQQVNENLQWIDLPLHSFYLPLLLYYFIGIGLAIIQWRISRDRPLDRGALRWVFLTILLAMGGGMLVYFLPTILGMPPLSNLTTMVGIASTLYVGFALGILRYQLFQLERWWFIAWAWFLGGLSVLLVDVLVVSVFGIQQTYALSLSLIAVGWLYFPVRQWLWRRFSSSTDVYMERYLPGFVEALFTSPNEQVSGHWQDMLTAVFQPLSLERNESLVTRPSLARNGALLLVPAFGDHAPGLKLRYGQNGRRLFGKRDRDLAEAMNSVALRVCNLREARIDGANQERKRIMRDLHDDVGGRLLTLMHTANDDRHESLARGALSALRETIYALDDNRLYNLEDLLVDFRSDLDERISPSALTVDWQVAFPEKPMALPPRYFININRVLSEAVSNALYYGGDGTLTIRFRVEDDAMLLCLENPVSGSNAETTDPFRGRGLNNMRTRINELDGQFQVMCHLGKPLRFSLSASIPVPVSNGER